LANPQVHQRSPACSRTTAHPRLPRQAFAGTSPRFPGGTTFTITPAAADHIALQVAPALTVGVPFALTVTVQDAYGNTVTGDQWTVHFQLMGPVTPAANYTFTAAGMGSPTFSNLELGQPGTYILTAADENDPPDPTPEDLGVSGRWFNDEPPW
jgi:hypothetical protein